MGCKGEYMSWSFSFDILKKDKYRPSPVIVFESPTKVLEKPKKTVQLPKVTWEQYVEMCKVSERRNAKTT